MAAGVLHQGILRLFKDDPWLAFDLLEIPRPSDGTPVDRSAEVDYELDSGKGPKTRQGFPDLVLVDPGGRRGGVVITVEAQKKTDEDKRWKIPAYQVLLALEHRLQTWVVVVSFSRRMSYLLREWSEGPPPKIDALILDVDNVPVDAGRDPDNERPTAAVLAAALHGSAGNLDAARTGLRVALRLPQPQRDHYANTVLAAVPKSKRDLLMRELPMEQRDELMDIERRSGTYLLGRDVGRKEGRNEGRKEGRMALIELIFAQLASRGITVDARSRARIRKTQPLPKLQRWALRAAHVASLGQLFEPD